LNPYCFGNQDEILFQGIRDDQVREVAHSYVILDVRKCNDESIVRNEDIVCRSPEEIDAWLYNKKLSFRII